MNFTELKRSGLPVETWEGFKAQLKKQFNPSNATFQARDALMKLRHSELIREFIEKFSDLPLQLPDMGDVDKVYHFVANVSPTDLIDASKRPTKTETLNDVEIVKPKLTKRRPKNIPVGHMQGLIEGTILTKVGEAYR